jgi:magnesium-transporting ATPase (P-type)
VLAFARREIEGEIPETAREVEGEMEFLGLVGMADPVRPEVPEAVARCRRAGIRVVMITGDHPATATSVAREAGLAAHTVMLGSELPDSDEALGILLESRMRPCSHALPRRTSCVSPKPCSNRARSWPRPGTG